MNNRTGCEDPYLNYVISRRPFGWNFTDPPVFLPFDFEKVDPFYWVSLMETNWKVAFYAAAVYIFVIFGLQNYMKSRPPFELRKLLFIWNLSLGIFSVIGFVRYVPGFLFVLNQPNGFYKSICVKDGMDVPTGFWTLLFAFSKFWELGDTILIVLRKRRLVLIQYYHHVVTMIVVWIVGPLVEPIARWYTVLNFFVHSLMYPYFSLRAIGIRVPVFIANLITFLQLSQMIIGFTVNMTSLYHQQIGNDCVRYPISIQAFSLVYGSFIFLFGKLFYDSVIKSGRRRTEKKLL
ncbi:putative fatty acid elongation protein 3 [Orchesella cincta]|uniref:Elongation of very long chain fatty acids protein n=1 Tax=Orchesella cincta TaxID=48709 RepID=A0A1D2MY04_ORCCI|nr:putative fatty acid elongation protein 3 [Orchesella cincta]